ncbi:probable carbohydrate esterase At4g34215 [Morus notabilis]|uniref:probable carbohydrate esterase At4g34215 n=1 Tax=Morus notabilis TaxID=981085 RepID=UPI000CED19C3|nr:probable carbohydrate esterase At4g34215 [Morus notabilis]
MILCFKYFFFFFFFFLWILLAHSCKAISNHQQLALKNIFILAGQSNMAGRGGLVVENSATGAQIWDGVVPPQCRPNPSVLRLNGKLEWVEAQEPLHADIDVATVNGVGPGMAFADAVLARDRGFGPIGLVPCAIGGTNISQWEKGSVLYRRMVRRARASVADGAGGSIRAVLWYQGESDTIVKKDAESYGRRVEKLFQDIRMDLMSPMLPIIQVALASGGRYIDIVREAQFGTDLLNVRTVDAMGLALGPDNLHLTTESQVRLGQKMANAFFQFLPSHLSPSNSINTTIQSNTSPTTNFSNFNLELSSHPITHSQRHPTPSQLHLLYWLMTLRVPECHREHRRPPLIVSTISSSESLPRALAVTTTPRQNAPKCPTEPPN